MPSLRIKTVIRYTASVMLCVLLVSSIVAWVRSYRSHVSLGWRSIASGIGVFNSHFSGLSWSHGDIAIAFDNQIRVANKSELTYSAAWPQGTHFVFIQSAPNSFRDGHYSRTTQNWSGLSGDWHGFGIEFSRFSKNGVLIASHEVEMPLWFVTGSAAGCLLLIILRWKRKRQSRGLNVSTSAPLVDMISPATSPAFVRSAGARCSRIRRK